MDRQVAWNIGVYFFGMATACTVYLMCLVVKAYNDYCKACKEFEEVDKHFDRRG